MDVQVSSSNSLPIPRLPPNPTRVDKLVIDTLREHARFSFSISTSAMLKTIHIVKIVSYDCHLCLSCVIQCITMQCNVFFRVVTLLAKMERLRGFPLTPGVHTSLTKWLDCVLCVQDRRRKEVLGWVN